MSNKTRLEAVSSSLDTAISTANSLPEAGRVTLPTLDNEGVAADLREGKELIDSQGNKITGTLSLDAGGVETCTLHINGPGSQEKIFLSIDPQGEISPSTVTSSTIEKVVKGSFILCKGCGSHYYDPPGIPEGITVIYTTADDCILYVAPNAADELYIYWNPS